MLVLGVVCFHMRSILLHAYTCLLVGYREQLHCSHQSNQPETSKLGYVEDKENYS